MAERNKLHTGEVYDPNDGDVMSEQLGYLDRLYDFNMTRPTELDKREAMLKEMFAEIGENCYIEPPFTTSISAMRCMRISTSPSSTTRIYMSAIIRCSARM